MIDGVVVVGGDDIGVVVVVDDDADDGKMQEPEPIHNPVVNEKRIKLLRS